MNYDQKKLDELREQHIKMSEGARKVRALGNIRTMERILWLRREGDAEFDKGRPEAGRDYHDSARKLEKDLVPLDVTPDTAKSLDDFLENAGLRHRVEAWAGDQGWQARYHACVSFVIPTTKERVFGEMSQISSVRGTRVAAEEDLWQVIRANWQCAKSFAPGSSEEDPIDHIMLRGPRHTVRFKSGLRFEEMSGKSTIVDFEEKP